MYEKVEIRKSTIHGKGVFAKEDYLLSDKKQWYKEGMETRTISKRPKVTEQVLVGRVYWKEGFRDEDNGEVVWIERSMIVKINGKWVDEE